jgi:Family of unknown function (DUF6152)
MAKVVTLSGSVTKVDWTNPHIIVYMDAKDAAGSLQHWSLELSAPLLMQRFGWTKNSMKAGDQLVAETILLKTARWSAPAEPPPSC